MILFLLLNIFLFNIELFSAEQRFLHPGNTVTERPITGGDFIPEVFYIMQNDKNLKYAKISSLGIVIGLLSSILNINRYKHNKLLETITKIEIDIEKKKEILNQTRQSLITNLTTRLNELKSENRNCKKYILGSLIIIILSGLLKEYFRQESIKEGINNLTIACQPETANLWNTLFEIKTKESHNKDFFNIFAAPEEREQKNISKKINFFKKIIKFKQMIHKTNKLESLTKEERNHIQIKIANLLLFYPSQD